MKFVECVHTVGLNSACLHAYSVCMLCNKCTFDMLVKMCVCVRAYKIEHLCTSPLQDKS